MSRRRFHADHFGEDERKFVIDQELLVRTITEATSEVFTTMLEMQVECIGMASDIQDSESGLISLVGITGDWGGSGVFCCSPILASVMCARMLGNEFDPTRAVIDEEVLDVVAEVTNMMIGNIKNGLEAFTGPLAISVPTVIHGRNFQFRNSTSLRGAALVFSTEGECFEVRMSVAPVAGKAEGRPRIPVLGLAQG